MNITTSAGTSGGSLGGTIASDSTTTWRVNWEPGPPVQFIPPPTTIPTHPLGQIPMTMVRGWAPENVENLVHELYPQETTFLCAKAAREGRRVECVMDGGVGLDNDGNLYSAFIYGNNPDGNYVLYKEQWAEIVPDQEEEIKEEKVKVRRKKKKPPFSMMDVDNLVTRHRVNYISPVYDPVNGARARDFIISPYTPYIPLPYLGCSTEAMSIMSSKSNLLCDEGSYTRAAGYMMGKDRELKRNQVIKMRDRFIDHPLVTAQFYSKYSRSAQHLGVHIPMVRDRIMTYLNFDRPVHQYTLNFGQRLSWSYQLPTTFAGEKGIEMRSFSMRSYQGAIGYLSLFLRNPNMSEKYNWYAPIIPVVRREDLLYHKLYIALYGHVDLTRVIVLIDRDFDDADTCPPALRKLYKASMEPFIKTTSCIVVEVPYSYIEENCFLPTTPPAPKSTSHSAIKAYIEGLADEFHSSFQKSTIIASDEEGPIGTSVYIGTEGMDETREEDDDDYYINPGIDDWDEEEESDELPEEEEGEESLPF